jgi:hypothetical protein
MIVISPFQAHLHFDAASSEGCPRTNRVGIPGHAANRTANPNRPLFQSRRRIGASPAVYGEKTVLASVVWSNSLSITLTSQSEDRGAHPHAH